MAKGDESVALRNLDTLFNVGSVGGQTDAQLIATFKVRRDEAAELAFGVLIDRHGPMVLRVCRSVLRDPHDADDAFQATFLVLVEKAAKLWVRDSLGPWLHQVAHRVSSNARLARARRLRHERQSVAPCTELAAADTFDDLAEVLHDEVGRLPQKYRAAVVTCLMEGLTPEQAASRLGWPVGTVHSRLARGRERLRGRLIRRGLILPTAALTTLLSSESIAVPPALATATKQSAMWVATNSALEGVVTASVAALTKKGLKTKMATKLITVGAVFLTLGVAMTATGAFPFLQAGDAPQPAKQRNQIPLKPPEPRVAFDKVAEPTGKAVSLAISRDGKALAAGCDDGSIQLLNPLTGEMRLSLVGAPKGFVRGLAFMPDGKSIASVCTDNQLRLWDATSGKLIKEVPALDDTEKFGLPRLRPHSLVISPDGSQIAVGGAGEIPGTQGRPWLETIFFEIQVLDATTGGLVWSHVGRRGYLDQLAFSPDGRKLASATHGEVRLWDSRSGDLTQTLKTDSGTVWTISFSPDGRLLAGYGTVRADAALTHWLTIWDVGSAGILRSTEADPGAAATAPGTLAFSPDGKTVATAGTSWKHYGSGAKVINYIKLWDVAKGAPLWTSPEGDLGFVQSLVFSPDGQWLFCCDSTATTRIDARTGQTRHDLMKSAKDRLR